jgi:hypothetical protein
MANKPHGRSFASDRQMVELAKSMTLDEIVKKTGRKPAAILRTAMRLGVSIKGWKPKK